MAAYNIKDIKDKKKLINLANYGTAERRLMRPRVLIGAGEEKPFIEGDILDANATLNLIEDTYDKGRIFRSFSKEGKKIDKEIKELLEKTDENYEQLSSAIADNKEDADQKIDQLSSKVDNIESNIPNLRRVVDIQLQSVLDGTKTYLVTKQGDVQEQIQISDGEKGEQGEKGDPFTYEDFTPEQIEGLKVKGDRGISISSLEQTQTAYTSGGINEFTVTLDDGTVSRWYVRNGQKGDATKIWVNANTVHSGYYDSDDHEIKLLNADGGIMSIIDATAFIKDGMISDAYVENGYIVIVFNTDAGQTPIMIPVTDIFDADDYYTKLDTDARIAEDVLVETQRAEAAELQLRDDLAQEVSDRLSSDTTLDTKIETETTRATTAEGLLDQRITSNNAAILAETTRATNAEEALSDAIDAEESTRIQEIDDLQDLLDAYIQLNDAAVQAEITRATTAEGILQDNIDAEETRATTAEQTNATAIATETSRAQSAELTLLGAIDTEASTRAAAITAEETRATTAELSLQDNIDTEEQRAIAAELDLLDAIDAVEQGAGQDTAAVEQALNDEISRATLAEQLISSNLSAEITRSTNADNANSTAISNEVSRATAAEQQNASDIDAIEALIPSLATSSNQLADKAFVNSSIATSTATFVGTFNNMTDLYAVTTADANDYGYVITTDSAGNTKYNRYKYDGSQWDFEYALNNSSFTAEEWAAIQSGMTQALRIKLENLPSTAVTSVGVSVPTGLTVTGSPITSSGTIAINFTSGYSIPTTSSLTNWDTAYGWGNHANANYVKSVNVGTTTYNPSSGIVSLPAYPTTLPASDVYSWAKASAKPSYTLDEVSDGSTRKLSNYLPLSGGTIIKNTNDDIPLRLQSGGSQADCYLGYNNYAGTSLGYIGYSNDAKPILYYNAGEYEIWHKGNLTNNNQLTNGAGYITSSALSDYVTLSTTQTISGAKTFSNLVYVNGSYCGYQVQGNGMTEFLRFGVNSELARGFIYSSTYGEILSFKGGKVGVGTGTPSYKLDVSGSANATTLYENGNRVTVNTINKTWSELKAMRDGGTLVPGQWYRITDFVTTTTQSDTLSAGHAFDIIIVADATNKLNENAHAALHSGDTYFANSKLESWKVWYCIDNDTNRFAWADTTNGKGVVYRMIDQSNNDLPYDFKNIQFKRFRVQDSKGRSDINNGYCWFTTAVTPDNISIPNQNDFIWAYTFTETFYDFEEGITLVSDNSLSLRGSRSNVFKQENTYSPIIYDNVLYDTCIGNIFGPYASGNTIYGGSNYNIIGRGFINNIIARSFTLNKLISSFSNNICETDFASNFCYRNVSLNNFGQSCLDNVFGNNFTNNTTANSFLKNKIGNNCLYCDFLKNYFLNNIIEGDIRDCIVTSTQTTSAVNTLRNIKLCLGVNSGISTKTISHNTVQDTFLTEYKPTNSVIVNV